MKDHEIALRKAERESGLMLVSLGLIICALGGVALWLQPSEPRPAIVLFTCGAIPIVVVILYWLMGKLEARRKVSDESD